MSDSCSGPGIAEAGQGSIFWENLRRGDVVRGPGITIAESHILGWAGLTGDWVALHIDEVEAANTVFGSRVAHGPLTLALGLGLITQTGIFANVQAWLGVDAVRALAPVYIGDTVHPEAEVAATRRSSKPGRGIWTFEYVMLNQKGKPVMTFSNTVMVACRHLPDGRQPTAP